MATGRLVYALLAFAVFIGSALAGYYVPSESALATVQSFSSIVSLPPLERMLAIVFNNVTVAGLLLIGSLLVLPALSLLAINGYVIGALLRSVGGDMGVLVLRLLPHGSLEVVAYLYVVSTGFLVVEGLVRRRFGVEDAVSLLLRSYVVSVYVLLAAAAIESFLVIG